MCFNKLNAQIIYQTLEQNNAKAILSTSGTQFQNFSTGESGYTVPKNTGITQLSGLQFWFAGNDANGQLHGCFGGNDSGTDVFPGINSSNEPVIYEVNNADMENFGNSMNPDTVTGSGLHPVSNETMEVIYNWPSCFPFFDADQDGVYDPSNFDYPIIKGCKAYYMIQNDSQGVHTYSGSQPLGIEMHYLFYQFSDFSYLNDATFVDVCMTNRSTNTYSDFRHSVVLSQETSVDETLFGCDPTKETAYIYSGSNGSDSQALGVVNLTYSSSGMQCFQNATTVSEMWANMIGMKSNGQPWTDLNGNNSSFVFSGNPNDANSWNQLSNGDGNVYTKFILNSATQTFLPNQSISSSYAILYANSGSNLQDVTTLLALSDSVHQFNDSHIMDQCHIGMLGINSLDISNESITLFPNPTSGVLNLLNIPQDAKGFKLFDLQGKLISEGMVSQSISVEFLREGAYFLQIQTANGLIQKRFVKN
jgi:hypothetical protein